MHHKTWDYDACSPCGGRDIHQYQRRKTLCPFTMRIALLSNCEAEYGAPWLPEFNDGGRQLNAWQDPARSYALFRRDLHPDRLSLLATSNERNLGYSASFLPSTCLSLHCLPTTRYLVVNVDNITIWSSFDRRGRHASSPKASLFMHMAVNC